MVVTEKVKLIIHMSIFLVTFGAYLIFGKYLFIHSVIKFFDNVNVMIIIIMIYYDVH